MIKRLGGDLGHGPPQRVHTPGFGLWVGAEPYLALMSWVISLVQSWRFGEMAENG